MTCPSIYVQETEYGVTVYPYPLNSNSCTGRCYNITSATPKLSSWAKDVGIESKRFYLLVLVLVWDFIIVRVMFYHILDFILMVKRMECRWGDICSYY